MAVFIISPISGMDRTVRFFARSPAIVSSWLIAVGFFGIAYLMGGKRRPSTFEILDFTGAFAVASALAAVIALVVVGRRRWAVEVALPILILITAPIVASYVLLWLVPTLSQNLLQMTPGDFLSYRQAHLSDALRIAELTVPTGAILGIVVGAIAGVLLILAGRWPRLIGWLLVGLLLGCVVGSVHIDAFGRVTDIVVKVRLHGANRLEYSWFMTHERLAAMGSIAGALVGATIACGVVRSCMANRASSEGDGLT